MNILRTTGLAVSLLAAHATLAQDNAAPEMADALRSSGKIYVVVAVLAIIFAGLALYLFMTDRRVTRLERESKK